MAARRSEIRAVGPVFVFKAVLMDFNESHMPVTILFYTDWLNAPAISCDGQRTATAERFADRERPVNFAGLRNAGLDGDGRRATWSSKRIRNFNRIFRSALRLFGIQCGVSFLCGILSMGNCSSFSKGLAQRDAHTV